MRLVDEFILFDAVNFLFSRFRDLACNTAHAIRLRAFISEYQKLGLSQGRQRRFRAFDRYMRCAP